ncbi:hypothetical protein MN608_05990 [Microdochium nivale]|nr:hypothetical protein MN608_05990 [Microdochium nivale]
MAPTTRSNPTHGQKVDIGADGPVTTEGLGELSGSLAAESHTFKEANQVSEERLHQTKETSSSSSHSPNEPGSASRHGGGLGSASGNSKNHSGSHVDKAPKYVNNVLGTERDPHEGPHGTNIKEDDSISTEDKTKNASFSQFGTKADPGRLAEAKFSLGVHSGVKTSVGGGQSDGNEGKTAFDALDPKTDA